MAFFIKQNDTSPAIKAFIKDSSESAINLSGADVKLHIKEVGGDTLLVKQMTIINAATGEVQYQWITGDTSEPATYNAEIQVTYSDGKIETFPNNGYFTITITAELA